MKKSSLFIISLVLLLSTKISLANETYTYTEKTRTKKVTTIWTVEEDKDNLIITGEEEKIGTTTLHTSKDYKISKFDFKSEDAATEYTFSLEDKKLSANGKVKNASISKKYRIKYPWIQQFGFGLKPFILSGKRTRKFCLLNPDDFSMQNMVATKVKKEKLKISGKSYNAQKITVTLQGFKSMFWSARLWFDAETGEFLKYVANKGPNTPTATITLSSSKKESTLEALKDAFFKND